MATVDEAVAVLARTPATLQGMLADLPEEWTAFRVEPDSWSPYDVLGHLIHGEQTDWLPRMQIIMTRGSEQAFTPFDREGMRDNTADFGALLDTFARLRSERLDELAALDLQPADLQRVGLHPGLGEVTLGAMLAAWVVHDLSHIAQIAETMAKRYRTDIGPWRAYLAVVDRPELPD